MTARPNGRNVVAVKPMRWDAPAAARSVRDSAGDETALDLTDVPAAVVCATCGQPDCSGCDAALDEPTHGSGVMAIIPWERPGQRALTRWWSTAHLATLNHRSFFAGLPDGEWRSALTFAALCELVAVSGLAVTALLLALPFMPWLPRLLLHDPLVRRTMLGAIGWGIPVLALVMVGLHVLYGLFTDAAAHKEGSRRRGRGLRFGLYSCAWDVVTLPLGLLIVALTDGFASAGKALPLGLTAPGQAVRGYLASVHALSPDRVKAAAHRAGRWTAVALIVLLVAAVLIGIATARR
jgi:hypothetical protein